MTLCIKCKVEYDDEVEDGCDTCKATEAMFRAWAEITKGYGVDALGVPMHSADYDGEDFNEDTLSKFPILLEDDWEKCTNLYQLERYLQIRLQNILVNRQKDYKRKKGLSRWEARFTSTPIWKRDTTGKRKAPLVSATCFDIGEKMKGKGGIMYIVKRKKDGSQFWTRYRPSLLAFTAGERWPPIGEMRGAVVMHHGVYHGG